MSRALARAGFAVTLLAPQTGDAIDGVEAREFGGAAPDALPAGFDAYVVPTGFFGARAARPRDALVVADAYDLSLFSYAQRDAATPEGRIAFESRIHETASALLGAAAVLHAGASARHALLGIILCFYSGYFLYIIFPAAPPRLYFESLGLFNVTLKGGPISDFQEALIRMMPNDAARAAFPSLHSAVSILSLHYAWKYCRWFFPILLAFVVGLLVSTVYLRHHWVVDLLAGALLVPWALWITPRFERWWTTRVTQL